MLRSSHGHKNHIDKTHNLAEPLDNYAKNSRSHLSIKHVVCSISKIGMYFVKTELTDIELSPPRGVNIDYRIFQNKEGVLSYIAKNKKNSRFSNDKYEYEIFKVEEGEAIRILCDDRSLCPYSRERTSVECYFSDLKQIHEKDL